MRTCISDGALGGNPLLVYNAHTHTHTVQLEPAVMKNRRRNKHTETLGYDVFMDSACT